MKKGIICIFGGMSLRNLHQPFEITSIKENTCEHMIHTFKNTFFEMVFVLEGKGFQMINDVCLPFTENKLFLIFPQEAYGFKIEEPTTFFILRFNRSFLKTQSNEWRLKLEYIFHNHTRLPGCILKNVTDKPLVRSIAEALLREQEGDVSQKQEVIRQLINSLITIAARNISLMNMPSGHATTLHDSALMLDYIHLNIFQPGMLKTAAIADRFNISRSYFSEYFKKKVGQSYQDYVASYKIKMIEEKLKSSGKRLSEIVYEFGFNDVSHLNHFFKRHRGMNPSEYRQLQKTD